MISYKPFKPQPRDNIKGLRLIIKNKIKAS